MNQQGSGVPLKLKWPSHPLLNKLNVNTKSIEVFSTFWFTLIGLNLVHLKRACKIKKIYLIGNVFTKQPIKCVGNPSWMVTVFWRSVFTSYISFIWNSFCSFGFIFSFISFFFSWLVGSK